MGALVWSPLGWGRLTGKIRRGQPLEPLRQNLAAEGWNLSTAQVAKVEAASNVTPVYPYWHQREFVERNPVAIPLSEKTAP
jgi:aryl-alcohol dehydrogenase-like predicted oxidoreductase